MDAIVAVYEDWGIGNGETQPVVLSADRAHFREITRGVSVVLGRKTLEDFPGKQPLKGRRNIILSRSDLEIAGAEVVHSISEALSAVGHDNCIVIGGSSIYHLFFPYINRVFLTKVYCKPDSSCYFPNLDNLSGWKCTAEGPLLEENGINYRFCTYERIQ